MPGDPNPVPVVQFDGYSSLRQLDGLEVQDEQMTAYVVYRTQEGGPWKKLVAKRDWACCTYDGGIATPLNPRLIYTAYQESGVRLGAMDTLPLSITGHQGDNNPDERFKGSIAEVSRFCEAFRRRTTSNGKRWKIISRRSISTRSARSELSRRCLGRERNRSSMPTCLRTRTRSAAQRQLSGKDTAASEILCDWARGRPPSATPVSRVGRIGRQSRLAAGRGLTAWR